MGALSQATLTPRIETREGFLLAGSRKTHDFAKAFETIPEQWVAFGFISQQIPNRVAGAQFGAVCQALPGESLEYMCAIEVKSFDNFPDGMGRMIVPAARYAVFDHTGTPAELPKTWRAIWENWLPTSGHTPADTPDFERYDDAFNERTGTGGTEIWFPIKA